MLREALLLRPNHRRSGAAARAAAIRRRKTLTGNTVPEPTRTAARPNRAPRIVTRVVLGPGSSTAHNEERHRDHGQQACHAAQYHDGVWTRRDFPHSVGLSESLACTRPSIVMLPGSRITAERVAKAVGNNGSCSPPPRSCSNAVCIDWTPHPGHPPERGNSFELPRFVSEGPGANREQRAERGPLTVPQARLRDERPRVSRTV
jgi:hypothetical protein